MKPPLFRRLILTGPLLAVFLFPMFAWLSDPGMKKDWNHGLIGMPDRPSTAGIPLNMANWKDGSFQADLQNRFQDACPGRKFYLQLFNQVDYSLFRSSYMLNKELIIGPGRQLDSLGNVLDARAQGGHPPDYDSVVMDELKKMQAQLKRQGKQLLVVITPLKSVTYPATISSRFYGYDQTIPRPYLGLSRELEHSDIPYVDGAKIFHDLAGQSPYPIFVRGGLHWTLYGAAQVLPVILGKIAEITHKPISLPVVSSITPVKASESSSDIDHDLADTLNLLWPPLDYECTNITLSYSPQDSQAPTYVFAGGSFCLELMKLLEDAPNANTDPVRFAFYGSSFFRTYSNHPITRKAYECALANSDVVVFELNENLPHGTLDLFPAIIEESARINAEPMTDRDISFASGGDSDTIILCGFSRQEPDFRWTDGDEARVKIHLGPAPQTYTLTAKVRPFIYGAQKHQRAEIRANGQVCGEIDLQDNGPTTITATFTAAGSVMLDFHLPDAVSPKEVGLNGDERKLALAFYSVRVSPVETKPAH